jgi:hypothetical protein
MGPVVRQIENAIDEGALNTLRKGLGVLRPDTEKVWTMFKDIVGYGFANMMYKKQKGYHIDLRQTLDKSMFAKALYIKAFMLEEDRQKKRFQKQTRWLSGEEMITIIGMAPVIANGGLYIVEDRQHQEIFSMRQKEKQTRLPYYLGNKGEELYMFHDPADIEAILGDKDLSVLIKRGAIETLKSNIQTAARATPERRKFVRGDEIGGIRRQLEENIDKLESFVKDYDPDIVQKLLEKSSELIKKFESEQGRSILEVGFRTLPQTVKILIRHGADPALQDAQKDGVPLHWFCASETFDEKNDVEMIRLLLVYHPGLINKGNHQGCSPLYLAGMKYPVALKELLNWARYFKNFLDADNRAAIGRVFDLTGQERTEVQNLIDRCNAPEHIPELRKWKKDLDQFLRDNDLEDVMRRNGLESDMGF